MERFYEALRAHRRPATILLSGFAVFITCFGFPFLRLDGQWTAAEGSTVFLCLVAYTEIGLALGGLFPRWKLPAILCLTGLLTGLGLGARFWLEFGEVSNTYNFTLPNVLLHCAVALGLCSVSWLASAKGQGADGP